MSQAGALQLSSLDFQVEPYSCSWSQVSILGNGRVVGRFSELELAVSAPDTSTEAVTEYSNS